MSDHTPARRRWIVPVLLALLGAVVAVVLARRSRLRDPQDPSAVPSAGTRHIPPSTEPPGPGGRPEFLTGEIAPGPASAGLSLLDATAGEPIPAPAPGAEPSENATEPADIPAASTPAEAVAESPFGPGSALPLEGGKAPGPEYTIKGNAGSMLFHPPTSPYYARTRAEVWFRTAEDATAAGFTPYRSRRRETS